MLCQHTKINMTNLNVIRQDGEATGTPNSKRNTPLSDGRGTGVHWWHGRGQWIPRDRLHSELPFSSKTYRRNQTKHDHLYWKAARRTTSNLALHGDRGSELKIKSSEACR